LSYSLSLLPALAFCASPCQLPLHPCASRPGTRKHVVRLALEVVQPLVSLGDAPLPNLVRRLMSSQEKGIVGRVGLSLSAASASRSLSVKVAWQDDEYDDGRVRVGGGQAARLTEPPCFSYASTIWGRRSRQGIVLGGA
ncbi:hypothetical protein T484DRAFT_1980211, partial [Baffinella frigidus]